MEVVGPWKSVRLRVWTNDLFFMIASAILRIVVKGPIVITLNNPKALILKLYWVEWWITTGDVFQLTCQGFWSWHYIPHHNDHVTHRVVWKKALWWVKAAVAVGKINYWNTGVFYFLLNTELTTTLHGLWCFINMFNHSSTLSWENHFKTTRPSKFWQEI